MIDESLERAIAALQTGKVGTALMLSRQLLCREPAHAAAWQLTGVAGKECGQEETATAGFGRAAAVNPQAEAAWAALGGALIDAGMLARARRPLRRAVALAPAAAVALAAYAQAMNDGHNDLSLRVHWRSVAADPQEARHWGNSAIALRRRGRLEQAEMANRRALALKPALPEALNNQAVIAIKRRAWREAERWTDRAMAARDRYAEARWNRAFVRLLTGRFELGWPDAESRWDVPWGPMPPRLAGRRWRGESVAGRRLLLCAEQGLGDTIQFCRYASLLADAGAEVSLMVPPQLSRLMGSLKDVAVVTMGEPEPPSDFHCPLLSVPGIMGTTLETIPAAAYLSTPQNQRRPWGRELAGRGGLSVGLCWQGNPANHDDAERSLPIDCLTPLLEREGVSFVALRREGPALPSRWGIGDAAPWLRDMADTAALIEDLDLVISCDTAVAHLAGAMGRPVWTLLAYAADWRWHTGERSPWYPSMRLFRQHRPGDWSNAVTEAAHALAQRAAEPRRAGRIPAAP